MTDLDKLIEAVEAGTLTGNADHSYPFGMAEMIDDAFGIGDIWEGVALAHDGSLDAARELHDALLPALAVSITLGGEYGASVRYASTWEALCQTASNAIPARAWLLAILRAYRATKEQTDD